jgi:protein-disulfide isomerase/uncharacterized membrane protein
LALVIALAFAAAAISLMLTAYHLSHGRRAAEFFNVMCGQADAGCDRVLQSRWGYFGRSRVPISALGVAYFTSLGVWYLVVGRPNRRGRWWHLVPLGLNLIGVGHSLRLFWVMVGVIGQLCWWCVTTHVINLLMLVLGLVLWPRGMGSSNEPARPAGRLSCAGLLLVAATFFITLLGVTAAQWQRLAVAAGELVGRYRDDPELVAFMYKRREKVDLPVRRDDPTLGARNAEHTVVVFSDFGCAHCRKLAAFMRDKVLPAYEGRLRLVFKYYPLDGTCNPNAKWGTSFNSCAAALAAEAARKLRGNEGFWKMHDQIFARQRQLGGAPAWDEWAEAAGLDGSGIVEAVRNQSGRDRLAEDIALAAKLGVTGTPAVFLDGKKLSQWQRMETWAAILGPESATAPRSRPAPPR